MGGETLLSEQVVEGAEQANNANGNNQSEGTTPGWVSGVAKEYHEQVSSFGPVTDFVKEALSWKGKAPELPQEGATAEEWEAYRKAMGIPNADKYELASDLIEDDSEMREIYHKANLTNAQAKAVHEYITAKVKEGLDSVATANRDARANAEKALKSELKDKYDATLENAKNFVRRFADEETRDYLTKTGLGNDAGLIKMFAKVQEQIGGDSLLGGSAQSTQDELKRRFPNSPEMWS